MIRLRTLFGRRVALSALTCGQAGLVIACDAEPSDESSSQPSIPALGKADFAEALNFADAERNPDMVRYYGEYFVEEAPNFRTAGYKYLFVKVAVRPVAGARLESKSVRLRWTTGNGDVRESPATFVHGSLDRPGLRAFEEWHVFVDLTEYDDRQDPVVFGVVYDDGLGNRFADYPDLSGANNGSTEGHVINPNSDARSVIRLAQAEGQTELLVTPDRISGRITLYAADLHFKKRLTLRFTANDWRDCGENNRCREINEIWDASMGADQRNRFVYAGKRPDYGRLTDIFTIDVEIRRVPQTQAPFEHFQFALGYQHPTGHEFWDNNNRSPQNYLFGING